MLCIVLAFMVGIIYGRRIIRSCNTLGNIGPEYLKLPFLIFLKGKLTVRNLSLNFPYGGWFYDGAYCLGIRKPIEIKLN